MKVKDYQCVWADNPDTLSERVRGLVKKGYELYGPPMFVQTPNVASKASYHGNLALQYSQSPSHTFAQVLIKPVSQIVELKLPVLQGEQSCANCDCAPNLSGEARKSCGRLG